MATVYRYELQGLEEHERILAEGDRPMSEEFIEQLNGYDVKVLKLEEDES